MSRQRISLKDIAEKAEVSKNTVSLALRDSPKIKPSTKSKIQKIAMELGYTPNPRVNEAMGAMTPRPFRIQRLDFRSPLQVIGSRLAKMR